MSVESSFDEVAWSYSTSRLYHSCPRRFYYEQLPVSGESPQEGGHSVRPPGAAIGTTVHNCIESQIDRWQRDDRLSLKDAQKQATEQLNDYVDSNEDYLIEEISDDEDRDLTDLKRSFIRAAHSNIERFFQVIWPQFDGHVYILHELTQSLTVDGNQVYVRPDLCTRDTDGNFVITDWKTTTPDLLAEPSIQLLTYALWAYQEYEPDLDRILVQLVHTSTGDFDQTRPEADAMDRLKYRIRADRRDWSTRQELQEFPPKPDEDKCRNCPELSRCAEGQAAVTNE